MSLQRPSWAIAPQMTIRLRRPVSPDPFCGPGLAASGTYGPDELSMNPHGALCVATPTGWLGIKPAEFEVVDMLGVACECGEPATCLVVDGLRVCDSCYLNDHHPSWVWRVQPAEETP